MLLLQTPSLNFNSQSDYTMRGFTIAATGLLAFAASTHAAGYIVDNYCIEDVYIFIANPEGTTGPFTLVSGEAYVSAITGGGNSLGIVKHEGDYWSANPKLILGTSISETGDILYWTLNSVTGDPMAGEKFSVTSSGKTENVCGNADGYGPEVYACADGDSVTLTLSLCK